nr:hypothetical protein [uncultured Actinoplanes sp.]
MPSVVRLTLAGLCAAGTMLGAAACTDVDQANAASITRDDLVSAMAGQLTAGSGISYTATYQLVGGGTATVTRGQRPSRTAYVYPGGRLIVTPASVTRCTGDATLTCTRTDPDPTAATTLSGTNLVTPEAALAMLNTAALDQDVEAESHDTTVAGRHANCLDLAEVDGTPAREFSVCVTNEGALASFTAMIKGERADLAMTTYADKVTPAMFTLPATAKVTDRRTK